MIRFILVVIGSVFLSSQSSQAADSPQEVVVRLFEHMKSSGSDRPWFSFVDWDVAFAKYNQQDGASTLYKNSTEMRKSYEIRSMPGYILQEVTSICESRRMKSGASTTDPECTKQLDYIKASEKGLVQSFRNMEFSLERTEVNSENAVVYVILLEKVNSKLSSSRAVVELTRKEKDWKLITPSLHFALKNAVERAM